jgi:transcriptional regulator with XRE-family HTH domain
MTAKSLFGRWIEEEKLSAEAIADQLDVTRSYVWMLATGRATPGLPLASKIAKLTSGKVPAKSWKKAPWAGALP